MKSKNNTKDLLKLDVRDLRYAVAMLVLEGKATVPRIVRFANERKARIARLKSELELLQAGQVQPIHSIAMAAASAASAASVSSSIYFGLCRP